MQVGCSQADLANELQQSESSISTLVDRMRTSRLLYRLRSKVDKRRRVLMLTDQGRSLLETARHFAQPAICDPLFGIKTG